MTEAPEPLVSDADRQVVVDRLHTACADGRLDLDEFSDRVSDVFAARTQGELDRLTADLPAVPDAAAPAVRPTRWVVGVFSGARRSGPWRPAHPTRAVALFGSCQIDLTAVDLVPETHIVAFATFGGIEVLVAEGVAVDFGGFALFGGRDDRTSAHRRPGAPVVRVDAWALFGGATVRTRPFSGR
jgi:hypothetical protein